MKLSKNEQICVPVRQTQAEANVFWADKDYKKWVVSFSAGSLRKRRTGESFVGAATSNGARRAALEDMEQRGHAWARSAAVTVRLATAQDLGCVFAGGAA